jgi:hypothetical protein
MNERQQTAFRIAVALRVCEAFRQALEANGDRYDGRLVPNLTSITDVLTLPFSVLVEQIRRDPRLEPNPVTVEGLAAELFR